MIALPDLRRVVDQAEPGELDELEGTFTAAASRARARALRLAVSPTPAQSAPLAVPELISVKEAAARAKVSQDTILKRRELLVEPSGCHRKLVDVAKLNRWLGLKR